MLQKIFVFATNTLIFNMANQYQIAKVEKVASDIDTLCYVKKQRQIQCYWQLYLSRHSSILYIMNFYLSQSWEIVYAIYVDIEDSSNRDVVFRKFIPNMVLVKNTTVVLIM